jgi:hypothetical protein
MSDKPNKWIGERSIPQELPMPKYNWQAYDGGSTAISVSSDLRHFWNKWWFGDLAADPDPEILSHLSSEQGRVIEP